MKINDEKRIVMQMIHLYCSKREGNKQLCTACEQLLAYAHERLERCKFGDAKPTCRRCPIHCYRPDMRLRMQAVMRYAGPRMLLHHPMSAFQHLWNELNSPVHQTTTVRKHKPGEPAPKNSRYKLR